MSTTQNDLSKCFAQTQATTKNVNGQLKENGEIKGPVMVSYFSINFLSFLKYYHYYLINNIYTTSSGSLVFLVNE